MILSPIGGWSLLWRNEILVKRAINKCNFLCVAKYFVYLQHGEFFKWFSFMNNCKFNVGINNFFKWLVLYLSYTLLSGTTQLWWNLCIILFYTVWIQREIRCQNCSNYLPLKWKSEKKQSALQFGQWDSKTQGNWLFFYLFIIGLQKKDAGR